jgi:predicted lactoylglutathione lyase
VATTQEAVQVSAFVPIFTVDDLQKSISFYEAPGFTVDEIAVRAKRAGIG